MTDTSQTNALAQAIAAEITDLFPYGRPISADAMVQVIKPHIAELRTDLALTKSDKKDLQAKLDYNTDDADCWGVLVRQKGKLEDELEAAQARINQLEIECGYLQANLAEARLEGIIGDIEKPHHRPECRCDQCDAWRFRYGGLRRQRDGLQDLLKRCYVAGHREGWQPGETTRDVMDDVNAALTEAYGPEWNKRND